MEISSVIFRVLPPLLLTAAWIVAVVFSAKMVKSGGSPEKFLLIGACLMLAGSVISMVSAGLNPWIVFKMIEAGANRVSVTSIFGFVGILRAFVSVAGIVLLILAFWWKFRAGQESTTSE